MSARTCIALACVLSAAAAAGAGTVRPEPASVSYAVEIEPLLRTSDGLRTMKSVTMPPLPAEGGALQSVWRLGPTEEDLLLWRVECRREGERLKLTVGGTLRRGGTVKELEEVHHEMGLLDAWVTKLWDGPEGRLDLRILVLVQRLVEDAPLSEGRIKMWTKGGPLVLLARDGVEGERDEVVFRDVTGGDVRGFRFGVPGLGVVKLAVEPFAGAAPCGSVRGHRLSATLGGRELALWSLVPILPEDPSRPGAGWTLYGTLEPEKQGAPTEAFHGGFVPGR